MPLRRNLIYIDGKDATNRVAEFSEEGDKVKVVYKSSTEPYLYGKARAKIVKTAVSDAKAFSVFNYLKEIAGTIGLETEDGDNILAQSFDGITSIPKGCALDAFLNRNLPAPEENSFGPEFFPFEFNQSQGLAVRNAFSNKLSVIEGPPGTGKTQTILNIIAKAVLNNQSVAVVSSNNAATKNVQEKLEKNGLGFIAAMLGNAENKKEFIDSQEDTPDLSPFKLDLDTKAKLRRDTTELLERLSENLQKKNDLALLRLQLENLETEYKHFKTAHSGQGQSSSSFKKNTKADKILQLWLKLESLGPKKIGFFRKILFRFKYGLKDKTFYDKSLAEMILICQANYYSTRIKELIRAIESLETSLKNFSFDVKMKDYTKKSLLLLKAELAERFNSKKRGPYTSKELRSNAAQFIKDYPVIMSTTYSLRQSLSSDILYDYLIIDEASQVDLATGALALSCAKRAVIVGDTKQLPNVVSTEMKKETDRIFHSFQLPEAYRYSKHSLLSALLELFPNIPKTLLREHYRCHPKIIEFCNKKFYNDQLIVHTEYSEKRQPLLVYKTVPGNHARENMNQRQIDTIMQDIIPKEGLQNVELGIVTPYRNQTNALQSAFEGTQIKSDTVDKFQGRENEVIILTTVDNQITRFTDDPNRLNVAISRAIDQLILVANGNEEDRDNNISDLIKYIEYNNYAVVQSDLSSIFDLLYKGYEAERSKLVRKSKRVSRFDSENLMFGLIKEVLNEEPYLKYDVIPHFPLGQLLKDYSRLNEAETRYAANPLTHLDFLIYNKLSKAPVLAVEVDGFEFHKQGTKQAKRDKMKDQIMVKYNFPILRFKTNESNEKERLKNKLTQIQNQK